MSLVDLATLTLHRRTELEARLNSFNEKCDRAITDINKLKMKGQSFVTQLNCEPLELKERFLNCMKQLDEYMYLITDFNLVMSKIDETGQIEHTPVHDMPKPILPVISQQPLNLMDVLSEPAPSTSTTCSNQCPPEKPKRAKNPKTDQTLIVFSSSSSSEETVLQTKCEVTSKEVQCELANELNNLKIENPPSPLLIESCNLPPQTMLEVDQIYNATIMHVDAAFFWIISDDTDEVRQLMIDMTRYYNENHKKLSIREVKTLGCCAFYDDDSDCYYRGLFIKILDDMQTACEMAEIFSVDTGEIRLVRAEGVQPLYARFCRSPPYARCCHLAGVDLKCYHNKNLMEKQEDFMRGYIGSQCTIKVDDNTSESLGVYVFLQTGETLNDIIVDKKLAEPIDKDEEPEPQFGPPRDDSEHDIDITDNPEYDDPVEAVTGYSNRDEADICKHYKGGPEKTCFKGTRCKKRHVLKHPDGWTLDRQEVIAKCKPLPLPAPGSWHEAIVTTVCHYDRVYVQLVNDKVKEESLPPFGQVMPPTTLSALVHDMNIEATCVAYKPLTISPALGEIVAAKYPVDGQWYRARVMSITRADQSVEVLYVDYGTVLWVKEDQLRMLEPRHAILPMQAIRCALAGVRARSRSSKQWAQAKRELSKMTLDKQLRMHVIARDYDEITVELLDAEGYSIAEQLAAINMVDLVEYAVVHDSAVTHRVVVP